MFPNSVQPLARMVYVQKFGQAPPTQESLAEHDILTSDEPNRAWHLTQRLLNALGNILRYRAAHAPFMGIAVPESLVK